jgi:hypothetical protein
MVDNNATDGIVTQRVLAALHFLKPMSVVGYSKVRVGCRGDGGYVLLDDFRHLSVCISAGIGNETSFDVALASRGVMVLQFDHTIPSSPSLASNIRFAALGLGSESDPKRNLLSLSDMITQAKSLDPTQILAKIDVEGAEWHAISAAKSTDIEQLDQLVIEFHGLLGLRYQDFSDVAAQTLGKLRATHFPFHVHGNNHGYFEILCGVPVPDVLEVSYARRTRYNFEPSTELFPTVLDYPNHPHLPDFHLGTFNFSSVARLVESPAALPPTLESDQAQSTPPQLRPLTDAAGEQHEGPTSTHSREETAK